MLYLVREKEPKTYENMKRNKRNRLLAALVVLLLIVVSAVAFAVLKSVEIECKRRTESQHVKKQSEPDSNQNRCAVSPFSQAVVDMPGVVSTVDYDQVFDVAEIMPEFPGGMGKLREFIRINTRYPYELEKQGIKGRVIVAFVVRRTGNITDAKVVRSVHPQFDAEALRVINSMPRWIPGKHLGRCVDVKYVVPVRFAPQDVPEYLKKMPNNVRFDKNTSSEKTIR